MIPDSIPELNQSGYEPTEAVAGSKVAASILRRADQWLCGLGGHRTFLRVEPGRLSLQCAECGYESPGWELGAPRAFRLDGSASAYAVRTTDTPPHARALLVTARRTRMRYHAPVAEPMSENEGRGVH